MTEIHFEKAVDELQKKTMIDIEWETAQTWGGRAAASFQMACDAADTPTALKHFFQGENFRQEAMEHAAMVEDHGKLVGTVQDEIDEHRRPALDRLEGLVVA